MKIRCTDPFIKGLAQQLKETFKNDIARANARQKKQLRIDQARWKRFGFAPCKTQTCLKQAYWERLAELETFYRPHLPLYAHASDKAPAIQKILEVAPLYLQGSYERRECQSIFNAVKSMKGIQFEDPVIQTMSYDDPRLNHLRKRVATQCKQQYPLGAPLNFSYMCDEPGEYNLRWPVDSEKKTNGLIACSAYYGLPPFKVFKLPPSRAGQLTREIFFSDNTYGPMNSSTLSPAIDNSNSGFVQVFPGCGRSRGSFGGLVEGGYPNYSGIIKYKSRYYYLLLTKQYHSYWLSINPVTGNTVCRWAPVKPRT